MDQLLYASPRLVRNGDLQTILPNTLRRVKRLPYIRERIETSDNDFLDLDWIRTPANTRLAIISHGLEASSSARYVVGMAELLSSKGFDVLAWNYRGCSGEPNRHPYWYHSGKSEDLHRVVDYSLEHFNYQAIVLVGFSIGGNVTLKYLGENGGSVPSQIKAASVCSVPIDLEASAEVLARPRNTVYMKRFMRMLVSKARAKAEKFPGYFQQSDLSNLKTFYDFDSNYTAPLNGYRDAYHYWRENSSSRMLDQITIPTLFLSSLDDPFLAPSCFPKASRKSALQLEICERGGHVGFMMDYALRDFWFEHRSVSFLEEHLEFEQTPSMSANAE